MDIHEFQNQLYELRAEIRHEIKNEQKKDFIQIMELECFCVFDQRKRVFPRQELKNYALRPNNVMRAVLEVNMTQSGERQCCVIATAPSTSTRTGITGTPMVQRIPMRVSVTGVTNWGKDPIGSMALKVQHTVAHTHRAMECLAKGLPTP